MKPQIIMPERGAHNEHLQQSMGRIVQGATYRDCSTICVIPTLGMIHARVIQSWFSLLTPMNAKFLRVFMTGMEVGDAYCHAVDMILQNPDLSKWKYMLTMEDDNMPPPDGLLKLIESIEGGLDGKRYDVMAGLYWTKGPGGQPMIYGDPKDMPLNFRPQPPALDAVQPCNGLGMGFNLFRLKMLKDTQLPRPLFKTQQEYIPNHGVKCYTQDLYFYENAGKFGYRFGCDTRVRVGHYDAQADLVW